MMKLSIENDCNNEEIYSDGSIISIPLHYCNNSHLMEEYHHHQHLKISNKLCAISKTGGTEVEVDLPPHQYMNYINNIHEKENICIHQCKSLKYERNRSFHMVGSSVRRISNSKIKIQPVNSNHFSRHLAYKRSNAMTDTFDHKVDDRMGDEDRELIEIHCKTKFVGRAESSSLSTDGRSNPAIPTYEIINHPPDFDLFDNAVISFRPL